MELRSVTFSGERINTLSLSEPVHLERCILSGGSVGALARRPGDRLAVRDVSAHRCTVDSVVVGPIVFENVDVQDLRTSEHLWLPGCAFRHCTLRGRIGRLLLLASANPAESLSSATNDLFFKANATYYNATDWALDISEASFVDWDCRSVPAHLIRINPSMQVRVSYEKTHQRLATGELLDIAPDDLFVLEWSLKNREDTRFDFVLATHPGARRYAEAMEFFEFIHREGLSTG